LTPRIARWGIEYSEKPGRYRWVVERALLDARIREAMGSKWSNPDVMLVVDTSGDSGMPTRTAGVLADLADDIS
jgi:hypothetical protein